jgi:two-component system, chemotaxis family, CheB/CheR fusion protein
MSEPSDASFEQLLQYLQQERGFDFAGYKSPSLKRRVAKRMQFVNIERLADYIDYLEVHPEEFSSLFNTILINVTAFFRDEEAWKYLAETIVPRILSTKQQNEPIRIWSAGCASGEEAYSIAMVMAEALGRLDFRHRVKIYASDVDEEALITARQAIYGVKEIAAVPEEWREKYFETVGGRHVFNAELRRQVIFGRHDLMQDAPMSRLDLLICRNTLMYFNAEAQGRILGRFHYAINSSGFLFLGKAEMPLMTSSLFAPVELKHRVFSKLSLGNLRDRLLVFAQNAGPELNHNVSRHIRLRDTTFDAGQVPQIVVDANGNLVLANQQARQLYGLVPRDIGRPFQDVELSYRPAELRSLIQRVYTEQKIVTIDNVERVFKNGESHYLNVQLVPLEDNGLVIGVCITFKDVTDFHQLEDEIQRARQDAETFNEELHATNEELQSTNEELETTNEELQSTNEELETTNEELQATNEELETMNEELQSSNEELQTINDELRLRTDEMNRSNAFLNSILSSLRGAVVVVDVNFTVLIWNHIAEDLWGLRSDEVKGQSLVNLDFGLPVGKLRGPIRACTDDGGQPQELILDAVNRRGRSFKCHISVNPFKGPQGELQGAILMMDEMGM